MVGSRLCVVFGARELLYWLRFVVRPLRCLSVRTLRGASCLHHSRCLSMRTLRGASYLHPSRCLSVRTLRGDFLCAPFEVPFLVYGKNVSREFWNCKLLEFSEECVRCREKRLLPFLRTARRCSSSGAFGELRVLCVSVFLEKMSFVVCWPCASGRKLLPPKVMCVRAVFFVCILSRCFSVGTLRGDFLCAPFEVLF